MNAIRQASLPGFDLGDYIKESIDFLRSHEPPEGYFVGFSGGKDSITTLQLCKLAGVKHQAFYTYTTIDPPEVVRFIRAHYPQVQWLRPTKSFFAFVATNAPPCACSDGAATRSKSSRAGTCRLKHDCLAFEQRKALVAQSVAASMFALSARGAGRPQKGRKVHTHYHPIFYWPEWAIWEFIEAYELKYPELYDQGFQRIGCICCPYCFGKTPGAVAQRAMSMQRWPGQWKAFEHAVKRWWYKKRSEGCQNPPGETADSYWRDYLNGFEK